ncbi:uroporphyrinogen-III synthase [Compostibacter hankyongensis]|uniref:Tetrapyrrole biosynthesis uroporphyrinogen III synthase domain-containing protein n=1 Tax=Compostibacter hankyongensis TaxID=1007089 RepID=A0ABP8FYV4_9BACT
MPDERPHILCTRVLDDALIRSAADKGLQLECRPFIRTGPALTPSLEQTLKSLFGKSITAVFTSVHAVETVASCPPRPGGSTGWHIACLAGTTQTAAASAFPGADIIALGADAGTLAGALLEVPGLQEVYFFCGNLRRDELPRRLSAAGITVNELKVYETVPVPATVPEEFDGICFFSPSAVKSFFTLNRLPAATVCFAIGGTTARELDAFTGNPVVVSPKPNAAQLLDTIADYFKNNNRHA